MYVLLVYDISLDDNGARVLRNVFKIAKKYLHHVQNSVFEGEITDVKLKELKFQAKEIMDLNTDSLIIFASRNEKWLEKEIVGNERSSVDTFL